MQFQVTLNPRKLAIVLASLSVILAGLSLAADYTVELVYGDTDAAWLRLIDLFSVNLEQSVPTWYATILLFLACVILLAITLMKWQAQDGYRQYWAGLAVIFLYLSIDEGAVIHEVAADPLSQFFNTTGYLYFGWQIFFVPLLLIFALVYLRFVAHLPARTRYGFIIAGLVYVGGAVLIEGISANELYLANDAYTYRYLAIATVEELCEMLGVVILIYVLLDYVVIKEGQLSFISSNEQKQIPVKMPDTQQGDTQPSDEHWLDRQIRHFQQSPNSKSVTLFIASVNAIAIMWIVLREASALTHFAGTILLLIVGIFVAGWIIGWMLRQHIQKVSLSWVAISTSIIHLTLPIWFRLLTIGLDATGVSFLSYWLLLPLTIILSTAFYSVYLPVLVQQGNSGVAVQIAGLSVGIVLIGFLGRWGYYPTTVFYAMLFLVILFLQNLSHTVLFRIVLVIATWLWFLPAVNQWSNTVWYRTRYNLPADITTVFSDYSLTQKIDVLQDSRGNRYLYQNGVAHFDPDNGVWRNIVMGRIPASLIQPENALVIGAGSMQMELMIANYAGHVTTIEPDARVAHISQDLFMSYNFMDSLDNRTISFTNPQQFFERDVRSYDLIAVDLPDVYDLRTGSWLTTSFFELVSNRLAEDGVFIVNLTQSFAPDQPISRRVAASLLVHFDEVIIVNSRSTSYAYVSHDLPYTATDIQLAIEVTGETEFGIFESNAVHAIVGEAYPIHDSFEWLSMR